MVRNSIAAALVAALVALPGAVRAEEGAHVTDYDFSFEGPFGTFDEMQLQRGFEIYNTVCNACHGLEYLSFQELGSETGPNFPEDQIKAIAAGYQCTSPDLAAGETRPCKPSDNFPPNTSIGAPDLALMGKARAGFHGPGGLGLNQLVNGIGGPEYIATLLQAFTGKTKELAGTTLYENTTFPGGWIRMPPPLSGKDVEYELHDPTGAPVEVAGYTPPQPTLEQEAKDVAAFLYWAAEPHMVERKQAGFRNLAMIGLLAVLLYFTNKKLWAPIKHRVKEKEA